MATSAAPGDEPDCDIKGVATAARKRLWNVVKQKSTIEIQNQLRAFAKEFRRQDANNLTDTGNSVASDRDDDRLVSSRNLHHSGARQQRLGSP